MVLANPNEVPSASSEGAQAILACLHLKDLMLASQRFAAWHCPARCMMYHLLQTRKQRHVYYVCISKTCSLALPCLVYAVPSASNEDKEFF